VALHFLPEPLGDRDNNAGPPSPHMMPRCRNGMTLWLLLGLLGLPSTGYDLTLGLCSSPHLFLNLWRAASR